MPLLLVPPASIADEERELLRIFVDHGVPVPPTGLAALVTAGSDAPADGSQVAQVWCV